MRFFTRPEQSVRKESYGHAIDEFIGRYCSEPRLAFNRTVVLRYRFFLEQKNFVPSTINVRLAAVRHLAYEAFDTGLLSPDLAAGIRRVKGAKRLGIRIGNWSTVDQSKSLLLESAACAEQRISSGLRAQDNNLSVRRLRACCSDPTNIPESASLRS
jgi:hypothetical protein